jgi:hypothetical protein
MVHGLWFIVYHSLFIVHSEDIRQNAEVRKRRGDREKQASSFPESPVGRMTIRPYSYRFPIPSSALDRSEGADSCSFSE